MNALSVFLTLIAVQYNNNRQEFLILERADMNVQYEEREGSRRAAEWKQRGLVSAAKLHKGRSFPLMKFE